VTTAEPRVLVTGSTGCLGRHLVESLTGSGLPVRALLRDSSRADHLEALGVDVLRGSLDDDAALRRAVVDVETVYHLGGVVTDNPADTSAALQEEIHRYNVRGTERLAWLAAEARVRRLVFCSSLRIFGFGSQVDWREDDPRTPGDLYANAKAMAETALVDVAADTGLEVAMIRPRFIYGNHDRYILPRMVQVARRGWMALPRGGSALCDMVHVADCVQALRLAGEHPAAGRAYNITSGERLTLREILSTIADRLGRRLRVVPVPTRLLYGAAAAVEMAGRRSGRPAPLSRAQLRWYLNDHNFSISRARDELGYRPRYRLADGLAEIDLHQFGAPA
jgi:nucleoside-diphosphate-sugar epimerase